MKQHHLQDQRHHNEYCEKNMSLSDTCLPYRRIFDTAGNSFRSVPKTAMNGTDFISQEQDHLKRNQAGFTDEAQL